MAVFDMVVLERKDGEKIKGDAFDIQNYVHTAVRRAGYGVRILGVHIRDDHVVLPVGRRSMTREDMAKAFEGTDYKAVEVYQEDIPSYRELLNIVGIIECQESEGLII